ncbi:M16 family metallopeptidase [Macrococcoides caseolyticum]|uniref:M16 family metallopeptidase n=1 Tax=Macrococcoides caseolyticum TaxID=69966 RepID=UPI001F22169B|nr:pitrilysin family protein [Macrococcus caseolyticus]MCE4957235.1 insulinase family protein [Macrococcus caseolyticus]
MEHTRLNNHMQIATHQTTMQISHIAVYVKVGTAHEGRYPNGIAHFIEHMLFKGTKKYPFKALSEAIDAIGGEVNAYTTKTYTCYSVKTLARYEHIALELLKEMLFEATFDTNELEKERQVILEEIKMIEDDDEEHAFERFESLLLNEAYRQPILGTESSVKAISQNDLKLFYHSYYQPDNMILSYVGNNKARVLDYFSNIQGNAVKDVQSDFSFLPNKTIYHKPGLEQAHIILAHPAVGYRDIHHTTFEIINSLYGGSMTSLLFRKLREEHGLCYSLYSSIDSYHNGGILYTYFATDKENVNQCLAIIREIHQELAVGIDEARLQKAKHYLITNLHMNLDHDGAITEHMGKSLLLYQQILSVEAIEAQINAVTIKDVNQALSIFNDSFGMYQLLPQ